MSDKQMRSESIEVSASVIEDNNVNSPKHWQKNMYCEYSDEESPNPFTK